jgi:hypothetical protein
MSPTIPALSRHPLMRHPRDGSRRKHSANDGSTESLARMVCALLVLLGVLLPSVGHAGAEYWTPLGPTEANIWHLGVAPGDPQLLLAGGDVLHRSTNGGQSWTEVSGPTSPQVMVFGSSASVAWTGCWGGGAYLSTDRGATWQARNNGLTNSVVRSIAVSPLDDEIVFATTEDGVFRTTNAGLLWSRIVGPVYASGLAIAPSAPQTILVGTSEGLQLSTDDGETWAARTIPSIPPGPSPQWIAFDSFDPDVMYVMYQGYGGGFVTVDQGLHWSSMTPGCEGFAIDADRNRPGFVYGVGGWDPPRRSGSYGLSSWRPMRAGWYDWFATGVMVDPNNSGRVYACSPQAGVCVWDADLNPPGSATDLTALPESGGVRLDWTIPTDPDVAGYRVFRSASSGDYGYEPLATLEGGQTGSYLDLTAPGGETLYYVVVSFDASENPGPASNEAGATPAGFVDLDPTYIERTPHDCLRYVVDYTGYEEGGIPHVRPGTENDKRWPDPGETVTFVAHVRNRGNGPAAPFTCSWSLNGTPAGDVRVAGLGPFAETTVELSYQWPSGFDQDHSDLTVSVEIDSADEVAEEYETNNTLTDFIQALAFHIYTDQETYDALTARANLVGTHSFEDWFQTQIAEMNAIMARSVYPGLPSGSLERVRIDRLEVGVPPGEPDLSADGAWNLTGGSGYADAFAMSVDYGLVHELMHQIGIIDLYNINMEVQQNEVRTPDGLTTGFTFDQPRCGIMGGGDIEPNPGPGHLYLSRWDVFALNSNCGYRRGYYGEFLYDVPAQVVLQVLDANGLPAANVSIRIFQRQNGTIQNAPVITGSTNAAGRMVLPNRPVAEEVTTATGHMLKPNPFGTINVVGANANWIIEASRANGEFDHAQFILPNLNLAYWDGDTQSWTLTVHSRLSSVSLPRVTSLAAAVEGDQVHLSWPSVPGASSYTVYRASRYVNRPDDPDHEFENWRYRPLITLTDRNYTDATLDEASRYAVCANSGTGAGPLSNRVFAPRLLEPRGVAVHPDGRRTVLDPQNGYALIRQDGSGTFLENFGSVHNHMEWSYYMANDVPRGRLAISHPGDFYTSRQSVKVIDLDGAIVLEIGDTGSDPGQMIAPAGVAVDGQGRIYVADAGNHRVQVFGAGGEFIAAFGSEGNGAGGFQEMRGMEVDSNGRVFVCDPGNGRVAVLTFDGAQFHWQTAIQDVASPNGVAEGPTGKIYVSDAATASVREYSADLVYRRSLTQPDSPFTGPLSNPTGMAFDSHGALIVSDTGGRRVVSITVTDPADVGSLPTDAPRLSLRPCRPNPFRQAASIRFDLPRAARVRLEVFDVTGRLVRSLIDGENTDGGSHEVGWDGLNSSGRPVAAGVYQLRLTSERETRTESIIRIQ